MENKPKYKEMPKPNGKSRVIAWSEAFRYANLVKVYNQCRRKKKWKPCTFNKNNPFNF